MRQEGIVLYNLVELDQLLHLYALGGVELSRQIDKKASSGELYENGLGQSFGIEVEKQNQCERTSVPQSQIIAMRLKSTFTRYVGRIEA